MMKMKIFKLLATMSILLTIDSRDQKLEIPTAYFKCPRNKLYPEKNVTKPQ